MDIVASFIICFILFVLGAIKGIFVGYTLGIALIIFMILAIVHGYKLRDVLKMVYLGGTKVFMVLQIFVLIGAIISVWMAAGTVQSIVFYGLSFINPKLFILSAFIISSIVSILIGTSFGTIGTAGIAIMVMARGGGVSIAATAGAIVAGAYFGDRCSPMSSSANLVANITDTDLYTNIKNMIRTSIIPILISLLFYTAVSFKFPLDAATQGISSDIERYFNIGIIALLPAIIILLLSILRVKVKLSMLISIIAAILISVLYQDNSIIHTLKYAVFGYRMEQNVPLASIITGGGIISMLKVSLVVFISSGFTGIFEATGMLNNIENLTSRAKTKAGLFFTTIIVSIITAAFGCTQVMSVMLTHMLMKKSYEKKGLDKLTIALDLENTAIVIAALIPWNIALLVPLTSLNAGYSSVIFCFYLYALPIWNLAVKYFRRKPEQNAW